MPRKLRSHVGDETTQTPKSKRAAKEAMRNEEILSSVSEAVRLRELEVQKMEKEIELKKIELEAKRLDVETKQNQRREKNEDDNVSQRSQQSITYQTVMEEKRHTAASHPGSQSTPNPQPITCEDIKFLLGRKSASQELPIFDGDPSQWPLFKSMFERSSETGRYTEEENLIRLQTALKGDAREYVGSLLFFPGGLERILHRLERRYGRPDVIVKQVLKKLTNLTTMVEGSFDDVDKLSCEVDNTVNTIELVGRQEYLYNPLLLDILVSKLNVTWRIQWGEWVATHYRNEPVDLRAFNNWFQDRVDAIGFVSNNEPTVKTTKSTTQRDGRPSTRCPLCESLDHKLECCQKFGKMSVQNRFKWAGEHQICFLCLKRGHRSSMCRSSVNCKKCSRRHHELMHMENVNNVATHDEDDQDTTITQESESQEPQTLTSAVMVSKRSQVLLRIAPVRLIGKSKTVSTFAFFDDGSTVTMIERDLAEELGLEGTAKPLRLRWTDDSIRQENDSRQVSVRISSTNEEAKNYHIYNARTVSKLNLPIQTVCVDELSRKWPHLSGLEVKSYADAKPRILIGEDNWPLTIPLKVVYGPWKGPAASKTRLGWVIHGNAPINPCSRVKNEDHLQATHWPAEDAENDYKSLHDLVSEYITQDKYGNEPDTKQYTCSEEDSLARKIFNDTTHKVGERKWETGLLWKPNVVLPDSKPTAIRRLKSVEKKMDKDPIFAKIYCEKLDEFIQKGYATKLNDREIESKPKREFYLPHLGVTNPNKPKKLRICFDASAKTAGISLNDALLTGPDLLVNLPGLLCRFREEPFAIGGDIKEMYPQILIKKEDQMAQKFLWRGMNRTDPPTEYAMRVMTFGAKCSPFSAQEVKNLNGLQFSKQYPKAVEAILKNHYMDDYLDSTSTVEEGINLVKQVQMIHDRGGFTMCNWVSNSKEILLTIPPHLRAESGEALCLDMEPKREKLLGMGWKPNLDQLSLIVRTARIEKEVMEGRRHPTKREVLRHVMSLYDPLGLVSIIGVEGKLLLQDIWKTSVKWEDPICDEENKKWRRWLEKVIELEEWAIPRCYGSGLTSATQLQLHVMCDASEKAYAAVAYIRAQHVEGIKVSLAVSRANVAPLKGTTIPRMELQAAVNAVRIAKFMQEEHRVHFHRVTYWTDSQVVLQWINNKSAKRLPIFVANRVQEIQKTSTRNDWRWIPSKLNCADDATRVRPEKTNLKESRWFTGPEFLLQSEEEWPQDIISRGEGEEENEEIVALNWEDQKGEEETLPEIARFSNWYRLIRATAWVPRIAMYLVKRDNITRRELEPEELMKAEQKWIRKAQRDSFSAELADLKEGKQLEKSRRLYNLNPFVDTDGILRVGGRLLHLKGVNDEFKTPAILAPEHKLTRLLLDKYHKWAKHQGKETILNEVRQKYWIPQARNAIRSTFNRCTFCQGKRAKAQPPQMAVLPPARLMHNTRPFSATGLDYFGPISVSIGRRQEKRYVALFTCMTIRAIHLELVNSLTSDSAIMAIRRFSARRGTPQTIYSDNATCFVKASKELHNAFDHEEVTKELAIRGIKWTFLPPAAPHMGGAWERLVRTVKTALYAELKERVPKEEVLITLLAEVENIVNSRPLTHVSVDPNDMSSITPNHILLGRANSCRPMTETTENTREAWRHAQQLADEFWKRWLREYIPSVINRTKWHTPTKPIETGDLVFILDPQNGRGVWPKGIVTKVFPSAVDGQVRSADVETEHGTLRRPVSKLCKLIIHRETDNPTSAGGENVTD